MESYIIAGFRTAVGKADRGGFRFTRPDDLAADNIRYLLKSVPQLDPDRVDDLIVGNAVPEAEQGMQVARMIVLQCLPTHVPGMTVNRYCASGLETIAIATAKIQSGAAHCIIAGGTESMSLVPTIGWKTALNYDTARKNSDYYSSMGATAESVANEYKISREDQDEFSYHSHMKAVDAIKNGRFKDGIVPITVKETYVEDNKKQTREFVVDTDEGPRADTSLEVLAKLKPVFAQGGSVTAGNSSQRSDGAAFVIVMSEKMVKELKIEPIARLIGCVSAGVEPRIMGIGPVEVVPKVLKQTNKKLSDIDLVEMNEAFASPSLAVIRKLDLNPEIVNVNGGAVALGHALGSTCARLTVQIINELRHRKKKYGLVTACVGGGQGIAGIIELLK